MKGRDIFVISWMVILFIVSWAIALGRLIEYHFWDPKYNLKVLDTHPRDPTFYNSTALGEISRSYYTTRFVYFLPHVICAIFWWNLYFFQLIPSIRKGFRWFHRYLGRFLMICVLIQVWSGFGLAMTTESPTVKIVSYIFALATFYCVFMAWRYAAIYKDIPRHKYWVTRLVGYLQTIALQRFWMVILIVSHQCGWTGLYPALTDDSPEEDVDAIVKSIFQDAFVICFLHAILTTEWYLAAGGGMTEIVQTSNTPAPAAVAAATVQEDASHPSYYSSMDRSRIAQPKPSQFESHPLL